MTLTLGSGPFAPRPSGTFNVTRSGPAHVLCWDPSPKRVRALVGGETVVDGRRAKLLHETGLAPVWYFPTDDVRLDLLTPTDHHTHCPFKGVASYWSSEDGGRRYQDVAWAYLDPLTDGSAVQGYRSFLGDAVSVEVDGGLAQQ